MTWKSIQLRWKTRARSSAALQTLSNYIAESLLCWTASQGGSSYSDTDTDILITLSEKETSADDSIAIASFQVSPTWLEQDRILLELHL